MPTASKLVAVTLIGLAFSSAFACAVTPTDDFDGVTRNVTAGRARDAGADRAAKPGTYEGDDDPSSLDPDPENPSEPRTVTRKVRDLTGPGTSSKSFSVGGTDLGIPVRQPNGKIAYIFGDTFQNDGVGGPGWRSPVLLRSEPGLPSGGIVFTGAAGGNYAKQLFAYEHDTPEWSTWLPSDAITIGNRMYLHYMVHRGLGTVRWSQIAYSDDNGENWTISNARFEGDEDSSLRQMWTWERGTDGFVYVMSTKFSRDRAPILYRVPEGRILEKSAYVPWGYRDGQWAWGNPPTPVMTGKFGEMCLRRVENKWVLAWFNSGEYAISVKVFDTPTADLTKAKSFKPLLGTEWGRESDTAIAQLYGGYIHPDSTLKNLHLVVSQWNTTTHWPYRSMQFVMGAN